MLRRAAGARRSGCGRWSATCRCCSTRRCAAGKSMLFEGAQGTLLDIDHGTYPYVTSSNASVGGVCTGPGHRRRGRSAACWAWPRPTRRASARGRCRPSCTGEMGKRLRDSGNEYGAVTGRPRRCGWYDAVAVRYGVAHQRPRCAGADQARRARRPRTHRDLHGLPLRPRTLDRVSLRHPPARGVRAGLRVDAGLVDADARASAGSPTCRRPRAATSRGSKRSPACRPRSSPPARSATTRY